MESTLPEICNIPQSEEPGFYIPARGTKNALSFSLPTGLDPDKEYVCGLSYFDSKAFFNANIMPQRNIVVYLQQVKYSSSGDIVDVSLFGEPIILYSQHYQNIDELVASVNDSILFIMGSQGHTQPTLPRLVAEDKKCVVENLVLPSGNKIILALSGSLGSYFGFETFSFDAAVVAEHEMLEYFNEIQEMHITTTITEGVLSIKTRDDKHRFIRPVVYHPVKNRTNTVHLLELKDSKGDLLPIFQYADTLAVLHIKEK